MSEPIPIHHFTVTSSNNPPTFVLGGEVRLRPRPWLTAREKGPLGTTPEIPMSEKAKCTVVWRGWTPDGDPFIPKREKPKQFSYVHHRMSKLGKYKGRCVVHQPGVGTFWCEYEYTVCRTRAEAKKFGGLKVKRYGGPS